MLQRRGPGIDTRQGTLEGRIPSENRERGGTQGGRLERPRRGAAPRGWAGGRGGGRGRRKIRWGGDLLVVAV